MLFEGAQGAFLDVDHGTYPYVTPLQHCRRSGRSGFGRRAKGVGYVLGIVKAYTTRRVGEGPFALRTGDEVGQHLGDGWPGGRVNTGRARRCGWFDASVRAPVVAVDGIDGIALTKLDVWTGWRP